jgi:hypothetical protein
MEVPSASLPIKKVVRVWAGGERLYQCECERLASIDEALLLCRSRVDLSMLLTTAESNPTPAGHPKDQLPSLAPFGS